MDHNFDALKNPFMFAVMAVVGCSVGHTLMAPLGLFELSGQAGAALTELFHGAAEATNAAVASAAPAVASTTSAAAASSASALTGLCHMHGAEMVCH